MYKQITAGNLHDLQHKMRGRKDCNIFIKPTVDMQLEKMTIDGYNNLVSELNARNITLILEDKDRRLRKVILEKIPVESEEKDERKM